MTAEQQSFAAIAEQHLDDVHAYLVYLTADRSLAEDLTVDTFERALRRWNRYDPRRGGARTWLCQLARSVALDQFRSEDRREVEVQSFPEARQGTPSTPGIPPFVDTGIINAQNDQRMGLEMAFVCGPLYIQSEYMCSWVNQIGGPPLFFQGAFGFVSYFLTGENRTYNRRSATIPRRR